MADGDVALLASMEAVYAEAAAHGATKVVIAIDLTRGYDEGDGERRCSAIATAGPQGNVVATAKGHSPDEAVLATFRQLGVIL